MSTLSSLKFWINCQTN